MSHIHNFRYFPSPQERKEQQKALDDYNERMGKIVFMLWPLPKARLCEICGITEIL